MIPAIPRPIQQIHILVVKEVLSNFFLSMAWSAVLHEHFTFIDTHVKLKLLL